MKKKLTAVALIVCMLAIMLVGASLAYFTDTQTADNTFTVGNVKIKLEEPEWVASGSQDAPEVYPGEALAKDPTVTNIGANPCFVRIKVTGLDSLAPAGLITYETGYVKDALGADWEKGEDGYFYYTKVLAKDASTTALFDQIRIPTDLTNGYDGTYDVKVVAEAVQAQGAKPSWSAVEAMTVAEIQAWFGTAFDTADAE